MNIDQINDWLLEGDVSIQYQVWRDLLGVDKKEIQDKIAFEGWGMKFLSKRKLDGHWGDHFYQPKWTSTHYTLLDLRNLNLSPNKKIVSDTIDLVLQNNKAEDGGIRLGPSTSKHSDVCVNGMFLNYASYFKTPEIKLQSIVDSILNEVMPDGGYNCIAARNGAKHSSLHTSLSVLEGLTEFQKSGYSYKKMEINSSRKSVVEFILKHQLFLSDKTGKIINKDFLKLRYPCRWRYDILRAMDYFQYAEIEWDKRMEAALKVLKNKKNKNGTWNLNAAFGGKVHIEMEKAGSPSRWNTLRVLRVLKKYDIMNNE
jgi:hypothetical protein